VVELTLPYALYEPCRWLVAQHGGVIESEVFEAEVTVRVALAAARVEPFLEALRDAAAGRATVPPR
jgi:putative IMPACT (imprinted ancient) family translation regulator